MIMKQQRKTVKFNVGGKIFEVSRSLLESYPETTLSRSAAEHWNADDDEGCSIEPIFIDRDSDRFGYVLDYMRDQAVKLPITVSKEAVVNDIKYFGFTDIKVDDITSATAVSAGGLERLLSSQKQYSEKMNRIDWSIYLLQRERRCSKLAFKCFEKFHSGQTSLSLSRQEFKEFEDDSPPGDLEHPITITSEASKTLLKLCFEEYGLRYENIAYQSDEAQQLDAKPQQQITSNEVEQKPVPAVPFQNGVPEQGGVAALNNKISYPKPALGNPEAPKSLSSPSGFTFSSPSGFTFPSSSGYTFPPVAPGIPLAPSAGFTIGSAVSGSKESKKPNNFVCKSNEVVVVNFSSIDKQK